MNMTTLGIILLSLGAASFLYAAVAVFAARPYTWEKVPSEVNPDEFTWARSPKAKSDCRKHSRKAAIATTVFLAFAIPGGILVGCGKKANAPEEVASTETIAEDVEVSTETEIAEATEAETETETGTEAEEEQYIVRLTKLEADNEFGERKSWYNRTSDASMAKYRNLLTGIDDAFALPAWADLKYFDQLDGVVHPTDEVAEAQGSENKVSLSQLSQEELLSLEDQIKVWKEEWEKLTKEEQWQRTIYTEEDNIINGPIACHGWAQMYAELPAVTKGNPWLLEELKKYESYFDLDELKKDPNWDGRYGLDYVLEFVPGYEPTGIWKDDIAHMRVTDEQFYFAARVAKLFEFFHAQGYVDKVSDRNWHIAPQTDASLVRATLSGYEESKTSIEMHSIYKDDLAHIIFGINTTDLRPMLYKAEQAKATTISKGGGSGKPNNPGNTPGGGTPSDPEDPPENPPEDPEKPVPPPDTETGKPDEPEDKDPADGSGPQGNADTGAGDTNPADKDQTADSTPPAPTNNDESQEQASEEQSSEQAAQEAAAADSEGGNTDNGQHPGNANVTENQSSSTTDGQTTDSGGQTNSTEMDKSFFD